MKRHAIVPPSRQRTLALGLLLAGLLGLAACQPAAEIAATDAAEDAAITSDPIDEPVEDIVETEVAEVAPVTRVEFGEWRSDLPRGVSRVVVGGGLINNGFPALSVDQSEVALLYYAGNPLQSGYPTFELHSTATLELLERIELFSEQEQEQIIQATGRAPNRRDPQLLRRIESMLDEINYRLEQGGFQPMETLFELPLSGPIDGLVSRGKRVDYPRNRDDPYLTIRSKASGRIEIKMRMPDGSETYRLGDDELVCHWGASPQQAWYDSDSSIMVLRMVYSSGFGSCEKPEQWFVKRLPELSG